MTKEMLEEIKKCKRGMRFIRDMLWYFSGILTVILAMALLGMVKF